ncbi:hypothetical protein T07_897 [Trichinella nelsoni]|uniref:Uncharacterized protein n=1 Tax=Trichinella nelsoni TaxID=6336 RepID=A0A0V0RLP6_9BILA|nr:hypothetical protein T07_897 [Trichinella nelsoni]
MLIHVQQLCQLNLFLVFMIEFYVMLIDSWAYSKLTKEKIAGLKWDICQRRRSQRFVQMRAAAQWQATDHIKLFSYYYLLLFSGNSFPFADMKIFSFTA